MATAADADARSLITNALDQYGLGSLGDWAWNRYLQTGSTSQVFLELKDQQAYKDRFPAMADLAKSGQAISEAAYVNYEQTVGQLLQQYGIPKGMYDTPQEIATMLTHQVSPSEVNDRLRIATTAAYNAPPEVKAALAQQFGVSGGDLTAYFLDPEKSLPLIQQKVATAEVSGAAARQQVAVDQATAERLAAEGVSYDQATQGFGQVAGLQTLKGVGGEAATQQDLIGAAFGDQKAQQKVTRIQQGRTAAFQAGGGAQTATSGVSGLGSTGQ